VGLKPQSFCVQILKINVAVTSFAKDSCSDGSRLPSENQMRDRYIQAALGSSREASAAFFPRHHQLWLLHHGCYDVARKRAVCFTGPVHAILSLFLCMFYLCISCFQKCSVSQIAVCLQKGMLHILLVWIRRKLISWKQFAVSVFWTQIC